ncbi:Aegerolysin-domain-containing protein [Aspergillus minisclerotigenes]|uniref:Aegerolysin-domain-containing protein n=1 Tax=Aspergillus minisclerotigenes TaxID=656917 RepID=A0A5N6JDA3_9EURO|nr:Aegerolysin-domain-containing protein [Aspergillus minisclerotigenes]
MAERAEAQWVHIRVVNPLSFDTLRVRNTWLGWGKFHKENNKSSDINKLRAAPGGSFNVFACDRAHSPSGTEGSFDVHNGDVRVAYIYWDCPWSSKRNQFRVERIADDYWVETDVGTSWAALLVVLRLRLGGGTVRFDRVFR